MEDITNVVMNAMNPLFKEIARCKDDDFDKTRFIHFNSINELEQNYEQVRPCYVWIHGVRFRDANTAYQEIFGEKPITKIRRDEFILQDRYGTSWCWADDNSSINPFRARIPEKFSDLEVLDIVFGRPNFSPTFSGPTKHIKVIGYTGRILKSNSVQEPVMRMPAYALAHSNF